MSSDNKKEDHSGGLSSRDDLGGGTSQQAKGKAHCSNLEDRIEKTKAAMYLLKRHHLYRRAKERSPT